MISTIWKLLASLRITVVCLAFGIALVFLGTLAQVEEGLYLAQHRWFKSFLVWWNPNFFGVHPVGKSLHIPFPGGYLIGIVLLVNLLAAHIQRFTWGWKKVGIQLTHLGIILLLVGQLATDMLSIESHMSFMEGEKKSYSEDHRESELAFITDEGGQDHVVSVPERLLSVGGDVPVAPLGLVLRVKQYHVNSQFFLRDDLITAANQLKGAGAARDARYAGNRLADALNEDLTGQNPRLDVWAASLAAVGEKLESPRGFRSAEEFESYLRGLIAGIAKDSGKAEKLAADLRNRLKTGMLDAFIRQGGSRGYAAEREKEGNPIDVEKLEPIASHGHGPQLYAVPRAEIKDDSNRRNLPYVVLEIFEAGENPRTTFGSVVDFFRGLNPRAQKTLVVKESFGTYVFSPYLSGMPVQRFVGTDHVTPIRTIMRFERYYHPFAVTLKRITHEIYPGTATESNPFGIPKDYRSRVTIDNANTGEHREVDIYMNNPLRYAGLTFFQFQMDRNQISDRDANVTNSFWDIIRIRATGGKREIGLSTLQVVLNPSWLAPYLGCLVVGVGMLWQFLYHLIGFIGKRRRALSPAPVKPPPLPASSSPASAPAVAPAGKLNLQK